MHAHGVPPCRLCCVLATRCVHQTCVPKCVSCGCNAVAVWVINLLVITADIVAMGGTAYPWTVAWSWRRECHGLQAVCLCVGRELSLAVMYHACTNTVEACAFMFEIGLGLSL
jgi:hypothetical protein